jgi:hypothetical protein
LPLAITVIDCVVAPVDQVLPVAAEDVSVMLPPGQKLVAMLLVIVGVAGALGSLSPCEALFEAQPEPFVNEKL